MRPSTLLALAGTTALALLLTSTDTHAQNREIQLQWLRNAGGSFDGTGGKAFAGRALSAAGDVNDDGFDDFLVAGWDTDFLADPGTAWLVYGSAFGLPESASLSSADVVLSGFSLNDQAGTGLAAAGDVNDDGIDDFLVGVPRADTNGTDSGIAVLIYGSTSLPGTINLGAPATGTATVFRGIDFSDLAGTSVAGVGDVNGDTVDDILIGAPGASPGAVNLAGQAYLIYGSASLGDVFELSAVDASSGVLLNGQAASDLAGSKVAAAGDVNKDGRPDLLISAPQANPSGKNNAGQTYIVYGSTSLPASIALGSLGSAGVTLNGQVAGDLSGSAISGGADVNGDGYDDVIVGADQWDVIPGGMTDEGRAYLVYGGPALASTINLASLGSGGVTFTGAAAGDEAGKGVALGGDMNRDGYGDVLVGAFNADPNGGSTGAAYLIHGGPSLPSAVDLGSIDALGVQLNGQSAQDRAGETVAFLGSVNGDGFDAYAVGARFTDSAGADAGRVYVIKGACNFLQADGPAAEGSTWTFRIHGTPGANWLLFLDVAAMSTPLETSKGPYWLVSPINVLVFTFPANGEITFPLMIPVGAGLAGNSLTWQVFQQPQGQHCDLSQLLVTTFDP